MKSKLKKIKTHHNKKNNKVNKKKSQKGGTETIGVKQGNQSYLIPFNNNFEPEKHQKNINIFKNLLKSAYNNLDIEDNDINKFIIKMIEDLNISPEKFNEIINELQWKIMRNNTLSLSQIIIKYFPKIDEKLKIFKELELNESIFCVKGKEKKCKMCKEQSLDIPIKLRKINDTQCYPKYITTCNPSQTPDEIKLCRSFETGPKRTGLLFLHDPIDLSRLIFYLKNNTKSNSQSKTKINEIAIYLSDTYELNDINLLYKKINEEVSHYIKKLYNKQINAQTNSEKNSEYNLKIQALLEKIEKMKTKNLSSADDDEIIEFLTEIEILKIIFKIMKEFKIKKKNDNQVSLWDDKNIITKPITILYNKVFGEIFFEGNNSSPNRDMSRNIYATVAQSQKSQTDYTDDKLISFIFDLIKKIYTFNNMEVIPAYNNLEKIKAKINGFNLNKQYKIILFNKLKSYFE